MNTSTCRYCGTSIDGQSHVCIKCYANHLHPCAYCMKRNQHGDWVPICKITVGPDGRRKRVRLRDNCQKCQGQGWLLKEATSG